MSIIRTDRRDFKVVGKERGISKRFTTKCLQKESFPRVEILAYNRRIDFLNFRKISDL